MFAIKRIQEKRCKIKDKQRYFVIISVIFYNLCSFCTFRRLKRIMKDEHTEISCQLQLKHPDILPDLKHSIMQAVN